MSPGISPDGCRGPLSFPTPQSLFLPSVVRVLWENESTKPCLCPKPRSFIPNKAPACLGGSDSIRLCLCPFPSFYSCVCRHKKQRSLLYIQNIGSVHQKSLVVFHFNTCLFYCIHRLFWYKIPQIFHSDFFLACILRLPLFKLSILTFSSSIVIYI